MRERLEFSPRLLLRVRRGGWNLKGPLSETVFPSTCSNRLSSQTRNDAFVHLSRLTHIVGTVLAEAGYHPEVVKPRNLPQDRGTLLQIITVGLRNYCIHGWGLLSQFQLSKVFVCCCAPSIPWCGRVKASECRVYAMLVRPRPHCEANNIVVVTDG